MKLDFKISEFNISKNPIPEMIADKILENHIQPMQDVRNDVGFKIWPSKKSGYRPEVWEKKQGRSGKSEHVFNGKGAVDWTCQDFETNKDALLNSMIKKTKYTRFAIYKTFIHADYKKTIDGRRQIFKSNSKSNWKLIKTI